MPLLHPHGVYSLGGWYFVIISDPRRGCYLGLSMFIFFFFFLFFLCFFRRDFVRPISLESLLAETPN